MTIAPAAVRPAATVVSCALLKPDPIRNAIESLAVLACESAGLLVVALAGKGPGRRHTDGVGHAGGQNKVDVVEDVHHALAHAHVVDLAQLERRRVEEVHLLPGR